MDTNKMREQFEVAFAQATALQGEKNGASERMKEFMRDELLQAIQEARVGDSYSQAGVAAAWWAWQASREAVVVELPKFDDYPASIERDMRESLRSAIEVQGLKVAP
ncbi:hypothetical protein [Pseudomonas sp. p21]|uniref:hypothetical protein n=1 Tax=Pseudomonas sp. p21 TaxID=1825979 RepID=UPI000B06E226|nr:hypothetical protein [Pseudomonas sp. p21]